MAGNVYILTGPAGIGKSTTGIKLAESLTKSAYIEGDLISHMAISGREKPWLSESSTRLIWKNIVDLTNNYLSEGFDVVIDYIAFWSDVNKYCSLWLDQEIKIHYVILWADEKVHVERDLNRPLDMQMGERVLILRNEFLETYVNQKFYLDNTKSDVDDIIIKIKNDPNFVITDDDIV